MSHWFYSAVKYVCLYCNWGQYLGFDNWKYHKKKKKKKTHELNLKHFAINTQRSDKDDFSVEIIFRIRGIFLSVTNIMKIFINNWKQRKEKLC
jgi:hypothetical protein